MTAVIVPIIPKDSLILPDAFSGAGSVRYTREDWKQIEHQLWRVSVELRAAMDMLCRLRRPE